MQLILLKIKKLKIFWVDENKIKAIFILLIFFISEKNYFYGIRNLFWFTHWIFLYTSKILCILTLCQIFRWYKVEKIFTLICTYLHSNRYSLTIISINQSKFCFQVKIESISILNFSTELFWVLFSIQSMYPSCSLFFLILYFLLKNKFSSIEFKQCTIFK